MYRCIKVEVIPAAAIFVIDIKGAVPGKKRCMFPGLPFNKPQEVPGKLRTYSKTANIASGDKRPAVSKVP